MLQALNQMITGIAAGPSEVSLELIAASGGVEIHVMTKIYQRVLYGFGMPVEWALHIALPVYIVNGDLECQLNGPYI